MTLPDGILQIEVLLRNNVIIPGDIVIMKSFKGILG